MPTSRNPAPLRAALFALACLTIPIAAPAHAQQRPLLGFGAEASAAQLAAEARLDAEVRAGNLESWMERMTREPFYVGAPYNYENAMFVAEQFRSWGYEVEIAEYEVLFPTPLVRHVEMLEPESFVASLEEPELAEDGTSGVAGRLPTYNAYSADGDVTAELVYVNQGIPRDYEELKRTGVPGAASSPRWRMSTGRWRRSSTATRGMTASFRGTRIRRGPTGLSSGFSAGPCRTCRYIRAIPSPPAWGRRAAPSPSPTTSAPAPRRFACAWSSTGGWRPPTT